MERRFTRAGFAIFAFICLVVLMIPQFRQVALVQLRDGNPYFLPKPDDESDYNEKPQSDYAAAPFGLGDALAEKFPRRIDLVKAARARPNDARAQLAAIESESGAEMREKYDQSLQSPEYKKWAKNKDGWPPNRVREVEELDRLLQKFPDDVAFLAARLRRAVRSGISNRKLPHQLLNPNQADWSALKYRISTHAQLASAMEVARAGQRLEPDNCFFDMMLVHFLIAEYRDKEAVAVLHRAAAKPRYDDHTQDVVRAQIALAASQRPLIAEDKLIISENLILPHFAQTREMARQMVGIGLEADARGDRARAVQIFADVASCGMRMRDSDGNVIASLVGMALQSIAWNHGAKTEKIEGDSDGSLQRQRTARNFETYARSANRPEIGRAAVREMKTNIALTKRIRERGFYQSEGGPKQNAARVTNFWWLGLVLLSLCVRAFPIWLLLGACAFVATRRNPPATPVRAVDALSVALAACGFCFVILFAVWQITGTQSLMEGIIFYDDPYPASIDPALLSFLRRFLDISPVLLCAVLCGYSLAWRSIKARRALQRENGETRGDGELARRLGKIVFFGVFSIAYLLASILFFWDAAPLAVFVFAYIALLVVAAIAREKWLAARDRKRARHGQTPQLGALRLTASGARTVFLISIVALIFLFTAAALVDRGNALYLLVAIVLMLMMPLFARMTWPFLLSSPDAPRDETTLKSRLKKLALIGALVICYALVGALLIGRNENNIVIVASISAAILAALIFLKVAFVVGRWLMEPQKATGFSSYRFRWFHASLGTITLLSSVAYLAVLLASLPARATFESHLDAMTNQGEMATLRRAP